mgnify:FL=1|tara:strand:- start:2206 stop:2652 length:447 start_codon:yes stop_codon:yes gene_type:complete
MKEVKITKKYVLSKFDKEDLDIFKNELFIYLLAKQKNISFIPKLIDYNCDKLYIKTENVGISLQDYCDNYGCAFDDSFIPKIKIMYDRFIKLGYFHNDLRLKNIIINPNTKKLYLIDFEFTDIKYKDLDDENIVKKIRNLSKTKSKSK